MEIDATFIAMIAFMIFLGAMFFMGIHKKLGSALDEQAAEIRRQLDDAKKMRAEADALRAQYQRQQMDAETQAESMIAQAKLDAETLRKDAEAQLAKDLEARAREAEERISRAEVNALAEVKQKAADAALAVAGVILASGKGDHDKMISASIKGVSAGFKH